MVEVLFQPHVFFSRLKEKRPSIWTAFGVYFLSIFLAAMSSQLALRELPSPVTFGNPWLWTAIGSLIAALIVWGLFGFIIMLISGTGSRAFEVVGWAAAPSLVIGLIMLAVAALFPASGTVPPPPSDPTQMADWMKAYQTVVQASTYSQISRILGLAALLWSSWILFAGIQVFARTRAAISAGVYLALQLGMYFLGNIHLGG